MVPFVARVFPSSSRYVAHAFGDARRRSSLGSLFCYDKPIPEEIIEKPICLSVDEKNVGGHPCCPSCQANGAVLCTTCSGSGLYIDSILIESRNHCQSSLSRLWWNLEYYVF